MESGGEESAAPQWSSYQTLPQAQGLRRYGAKFPKPVGMGSVPPAMIQTKIM